MALHNLVLHHLTSGECLPQPWITEGRIVLIHKAGPKSVPGNFRPIACLNTCYKLLTGYVTMYLNQHVTERNIMPKEQIAFLKEEYGLGGHNGALPGSFHSFENHDGKGIELKKPDCANVQMPWNTVAKRIAELIRKDRYFTPQEHAKYEELQSQHADKHAGSFHVWLLARLPTVLACHVGWRSGRFEFDRPKLYPTRLFCWPSVCDGGYAL